MKTKASLIIVGLISSLISVVGISSANAECTAGDPCGTWAMLDTQGVVTNVIVCQASVCGGGTWAGQTVVPQVAPNPVTNDTTGMGSYIGNPDQTTQVTYSEGTFTIHEPSVVQRSEVEIDLNNNDITTIVSSVEIPILSKTFNYSDTFEKLYGNVPMKIKDVDNNKPTKLTVNKKQGEENIDESTIFYGRKTEQEIVEQLVTQQLNLINSKIQTFLRLLSDFIK
jgi:hypothetical protein